jgi:hypothetical protein
MGTVFNRGTKDKPNWYVGYRENGGWKYRASHQATKALAKRFVQEIEGRIARGQVGIEEPSSAPLCGPLIEQFLEGLANRNADDDRSRGRRHLLSRFAGLRVAEVTLATVMAWIDEQRAAGDLSDASVRHNMNLLSRFFSWAIARGKASINPVLCQMSIEVERVETGRSETPRPIAARRLRSESMAPGARILAPAVPRGSSAGQDHDDGACRGCRRSSATLASTA